MTRLGVAVAGCILIIGGLIGAATVGCNMGGIPTEGMAADSPESVKTQEEDLNEGAGQGMAALRAAAKSGKYLFAFFFKSEDEQTLAMRKVFDGTLDKLTDRAARVAVNISDASEKAIVAKFDLGRAPMPLVLAVAPNGAITGGFPTKFEQRQLMEAFASPATEKCMQSLQDGKLVLLCVQNAKTKSNDAAMQGVNDFKADQRYGHATTVITLDPADTKEVGFLGDLKVSPEATEAITVFLAPPGRPLAKYEGATSKDTLVDTLSRANAGCGPNGCGPGGCCPPK